MSFEGIDNSSKEYLVQCLSELAVGGTLLKAGRSGKNHFRHFSLSLDLTRLTWESNKRSDAAVLISQITELKLGQNTPNFKRNPLLECESRSFSLLYSERSLDIVCKDKREFEVWTTALQALLDGFNDKAAVDEYFQQSNLQSRSGTLREDRIKVALGTLRTKVLVQESACDLYTWGSGVRGMLGHKDEDQEKLPRVVESLLGRDIGMAVCGVSHTLALSMTGEVYSWGSGIYGQLGHGNMRDRFSPLMIGAPLRGTGITLVACHEYHSAAVADNGELFTWGKAGPHLGYEVTTTKQTSPRRVEFPRQDRIVQVACGVMHTLACSDKGKVYSFGSNKYGELGLIHPTPPFMATPTHISSLTDVAKVSCGRHHSAAIDSNGHVWMWGWGARGQLGQANNDDINSPTLVEVLTDTVTDISCGDAHNCALVASGNVYSWGDNSAGQLGITHSTYTEITKPRQISITTGHNIIQVACGANFSAALSSVGRVFTWGYGASGQLANNELKGRQQAIEVEALLDKQVRMVACGAEHMACTVVHGWVPDEEAKACMACKKTFTPIRRRHHCRKCGGIYCGTCTTKRFPLLDRGYSDPVRVCERCYGVLTKE